MALVLSIDQAARDSLALEAESCYPEECCGILLGHVQGDQTIVERVAHAKNIARGSRKRNYQVDWKTLLKAARSTRNGKLRIVGYYHSHPGGSSIPSVHDRNHAWVGFSYLIVALRKRHVRVMSSWHVLGAREGLVEQEVQVSPAGSAIAPEKTERDGGRVDDSRQGPVSMSANPH